MSRERLPEKRTPAIRWFRACDVEQVTRHVAHAARNTGQHSGCVWSIRQDADAEKILD
jgi:hypothetical protein